MADEESLNEQARKALDQIKAIFDAADGVPTDPLSQAEMEMIFTQAEVDGIITRDSRLWGERQDPDRGVDWT